MVQRVTTTTKKKSVPSKKSAPAAKKSSHSSRAAADPKTKPAKPAKKAATKAAKKTPAAPKKSAVVKTAPALAFVVKRSGIQGKGAFATRDIGKDERLVEYVGERISQGEAARRYDDTAMKRHHTFLFTISERTCIDGNEHGNDSRYFNHSCSPNCETEVIRGRVYIHTRRAVRAGEELTYDYNYDLDGDITEESLRTYACLCGSPTCRATILGPDARKRAPRGALAKIKAERRVSA